MLERRRQGQPLGSGVSYWTEILPFICLMALGMGAVFVPLTLTAVHHLRAEDAGVGSGVLNTMQQVGGAFGLAALAHGRQPLHQRPDRVDRRRPSAAASPSSTRAWSSSCWRSSHLSSPSELVGALAYIGGFPTGATHAFLVGVFMMLAGSAVVWIFLDVKHEELATDAPGGRPRRLIARRTTHDAPGVPTLRGRRRLRDSALSGRGRG